MIDSYTPYPSPTRLQRGTAGLTKALRLSTLLPQEQAAISLILQSLNEAENR